jgi:hypothetical protein
METFSPANMMEFAATEGLAYNAEKRFRVDIAPWYRAKGIVAAVGEFSEEKIRALREPFLEEFGDRQGWDWQEHGEWHRRVYKWGLNRAELVGIHAVSQQVGAGVEVASLLDLPAAEVLRVQPRRAPAIPTIRVRK